MVMARKRKSEDEIDDLVDDLDELDEEEVEDDEEVEEEDDDLEDEEEDDEDEEDDPDEKPARSKSKRTSKKTAAKKEKSGIGTKEIAEALGTTPRQLRMFLRGHKFQTKDDRDGRYNWSSLNHPEVKKIMKAFESNAAKAANKAKTDEVKGKKTTTKKTTTKKTRRVKADA